MIGQKDLISRIEAQIENNTLARFSIFIGQEGSGKRTLMRELANKHWKLVEELPDVKIDTIRKMVDDVYRLSDPTVYIIPDAHLMSVQAKNAILKIVEEPPHKAYFFMSSVAVEELLPTITSRGSIFYMRPYSKDEKLEFLKQYGKHQDEQELSLILEVCNNVSEIENFLKSNPIEFRKYVRNLISDIESESAIDVMLYSSDIAFKKDDEDKHDLYLLWKMCCVEWRIMIDESRDDKKLYADLISETTRRMSDIRTTSINRASTFDVWIFDCRKIVKKWRSE